MNFENLGKIFDKSWQSKKMLSTKISNKSIDDAYTLAKNRGSLGGKIAGAGGGGFFLCLLDNNKLKKVRKNFSKSKLIEIDYEPHGSRVVSLIYN